MGADGWGGRNLGGSVREGRRENSTASNVCVSPTDTHSPTHPHRTCPTHPLTGGGSGVQCPLVLSVLFLVGSREQLIRVQVWVRYLGGPRRKSATQSPQDSAAFEDSMGQGGDCRSEVMVKCQPGGQEIHPAKKERRVCRWGGGGGIRDKSREGPIYLALAPKRVPWSGSRCPSQPPLGLPHCWYQVSGSPALHQVSTGHPHCLAVPT